MYAIVKTGGKQYRAEAGRTLEVERLPVGEGDTVELGEVLMIADDGDVTIGTPLIEGARVIAHVDSNGRAPKIIVFKYKSKVRYRKKTGHRQNFTRLTVEQILRPGEGAEVVQRKPAKVEAAVDTKAELAEPVAIEVVETEAPKPRARRTAPAGEKKSAKPPLPKAKPAKSAKPAAPKAKPAKSAKPAAPRAKAAKAEKPAAKPKAEKPAAKPKAEKPAAKAKTPAKGEAKTDDKPKTPRRRPPIGRKKETE